MVNEFNITLKQQFLVAYHAWLPYLIGSVILLPFIGFGNHMWLVFPFCFFLVVDILPSTALHIQYYLRNRNASLIIDRTNDSILLIRNGVVNNFQISDISSLLFVYSYGVDFPGKYGFAQYRFFKIDFQNGQSIIITCLMVHDIENTLGTLLKLKPEIKKKLFPFIEKS